MQHQELIQQGTGASSFSVSQGHRISHCSADDVKKHTVPSTCRPPSTRSRPDRVLMRSCMARRMRLMADLIKPMSFINYNGLRARCWMEGW